MKRVVREGRRRGGGGLDEWVGQVSEWMMGEWDWCLHGVLVGAWVEIPFSVCAVLCCMRAWPGMELLRYSLNSADLLDSLTLFMSTAMPRSC